MAQQHEDQTGAAQPVEHDDPLHERFLLEPLFPTALERSCRFDVPPAESCRENRVMIAVARDPQRGRVVGANASSLVTCGGALD
jgi:hypothetical protein